MCVGLPVICHGLYVMHEGLPVVQRVCLSCAMTAIMTNAGDVMVMWFTSYANLVMPCWACASCVHVHGTCALSKNGVPKYPSCLAFIQADLNLGKIATSHFQVLSTQNANENMPDMFSIAYLNENLRSCNENLAWGK